MMSKEIKQKVNIELGRVSLTECGKACLSWAWSEDSYHDDSCWKLTLYGPYNPDEIVFPKKWASVIIKVLQKGEELNGE